MGYRIENGFNSINHLYLNSGCIIGSVEIVDCVINHSSIWAENTNIMRGDKPVYNWVLADPIKFPEPIPARGKLSFWEYEGELPEIV